MIGDEFEAPALGVRPGSASAADLFVPDGATLVASGRQALSLVAQDLRARGVTTVLVPDHHCTTMVLPFQLEGLHVTTVATDERCLLDPGALAAALTDRAAVLHCETFGNLAGPALARVLARARRGGVPVVVDETHSVLGPDHADGDYRVASLRKLLPVPDGAWVTGLAAPPGLTPRAVDREITRLRIDAAARRRAPLHGREGAAEVQALFGRAEELMGQALAPSPMSPQAREVLTNLDGDALLARRRANAVRLRGALAEAGLEVLNPDASPCFVMVRHDRAGAVIRRLARAGIVGPVYWPRPAGLSRERRWRTDLVSLPVDHRYGAAEMDQVARAVVAAAAA
ncbi:DegT/DnrJ/EryC1/StrS family aminotransferase [Georgenia thermotolerans]|uniref:DegT/DnrJ/EryC1/StrS family aminotransferase n=1 Tax=Georgenia thermotolerans TaxID=527326 RepID=UPI0014794072|nr:DegT/DnrJ/EryC1/StrS family aminotransferase [Georgenia thermotolerans]